MVITEEWIEKRYKEIDECFRLLNIEIEKIKDASTLEGSEALQTAAYLSKFYINYRVDFNRAVRNFYGRERKSNINPDDVYTKPLRQR